MLYSTTSKQDHPLRGRILRCCRRTESGYILITKSTIHANRADPKMILAPPKNRYVSMIFAMRRRNSAPITLPIAVVMALLFALMGTGDFTMAQDIVGRMSGPATDSQGAVVPDARVTITNEATGVSRPPISTNGAGFYVADALPNQEVENVPLNLDAKLY